MTIAIDSISRCAGLNHINLLVRINGGALQTVTVLRSEFDLEPGEQREAAISRVRSAIKEAGAVTAGQIQTALVGKTFTV